MAEPADADWVDVARCRIGISGGGKVWLSISDRECVEGGKEQEVEGAMQEGYVSFNFLSTGKYSDFSNNL